MEWSADLQEKMDLLTPAQRRAIIRILLGEAAGVPLTRLLKTAYSCSHCGKVIGRSGDEGVSRKEDLATHEAMCESDEKWVFAANYATYYGKWRESIYFLECLNEARAELVSAALDETIGILQLGAPQAARELLRQVAEGEKDVDKRSSSFGILDRAAMGTARKVDDSMARWLAELRTIDEPMADDGAEGSDLPTGGLQSDAEPGENS